MKTTYKGWEIDAHKELSLGGERLLYFALFDTEGCEIASGPYSGDETTREFVALMKKRVDQEIADRNKNDA